MSKIKILVASHKPDKVYRDDVYTPIHVGRAISHFKDEMGDLIGDDTGGNISNRNKTYCELTAIYWAWKNLRDVEYIGLAHYRRYFETKFTNENIDNVFENIDVVLAKPIPRDKHLDDKLSKVLTMEDYVILLKVIKVLYPEYESSMIDYLYDFKDIAYNMFVMRSQQFVKYAEFLFGILFECERNMKVLPYTCSARRMGYIAEFLLPIFCYHNKLRIRYDKIVPMIGDRSTWRRDLVQEAKIAILHKIYDKHKPTCFEQMYDSAVLNGLHIDNIEI